MADVFMPQLGETVAEGTVTQWFKKVGDTVSRGEPLFEISTDKVDTEIPAQADGVLIDILVPQGTTVDVGTKLATISGADEVASSSPTPSVPPAAPTPTTPNGAKSNAPLLAVVRSGEKLSPVVRRLLAENGLSVDEVTGTGPGGRITKDDVLATVAASAASSTSSSVAQLSPVVRRLLAESGLDPSQVNGTGPDSRITRRDVELAVEGSSTLTSSPSRGDDEVIAFSKIRKLTAEHMVRSQATSAHTLMVKEIDFEAVERVRRGRGAAFKTAEGFSLTYLPFIAVATMEVLREFPHLNASVGDDELIVHYSLNLGVAVDLDSEGLVVPVVKRADTLNVSDMARTIRNLATRARSKSLGVDDMSAGTFTITNPGPYGTLMTGAIINQPQVAILSTDGVTRKPVVLTGADGSEAIAIHSVGLVALTFDHRAVDGAYAARFLARLAQVLQESDWAMRL